jgi:hypothetical protein
MIKSLTLIAAISFAFSGAAFADSYKLDAKGKCHADSGKFAKQELCATAVTHTYKADSKGKCRDEKGKFADAKLCHA